MSALDLNSVAVVHNESENRFEASVDAGLAVVTYRMYPGKIIFEHTEVPQSVQSQGLAAKVVAAALDYARANHLQVLATCSYVRNFLRKHSEYQDIVAPEQWKKIAPASSGDASS
jgi:predicted GNAT family acetyltransferase